MVFYEIPHFASSANIYLYSNLDEDVGNESWGIRNVHVYVETRHHGSVVDDLEGAFTTSNGWSVSGALSSDKIKNCEGTVVFGGYNTFGKGTSITKKFSDLAAHEFVRVAFRFYFIDSWDNETL